MTDQELFDRVVGHLVKQGRPASDAYGRCSYRMADGRRCAIGCLIPDGKYSPAMERHSCHKRSVYTAAGLTVDQAFAVGHELQSCHDAWMPDRPGASVLFDRLCRAAKEYGLDAACVVDAGVSAFCWGAV